MLPTDAGLAYDTRAGGRLVPRRRVGRARQLAGALVRLSSPASARIRGALACGGTPRARALPEQCQRRQRTIRLEAKHPPIKSQLRLERAHDVLRLAKPMLLALEFDIRNRHSLRLQGRDNGAGLIGRDHLILRTLERNERGLEVFEMPDRRSRFVDRSSLRQRSNEPVQI